MENSKQIQLVSVCMITYNHEKYIAQAIEGVLMQKTPFNFELVISDDCSSDRTGEICLEYKNKFSEKVRLIRRDKNFGFKKNFGETLAACSGKYIALCEGDDYWTDPHKLQKQVEFLEKNEEFSLTHHDATIVDESGTVIAPGRFKPGVKEIYESSDLFKLPPIITCTMLFRNIFSDQVMPPEYWLTFGGDKFISVMLGLHGKAYRHRDIGNSVYRIHPGGINSGVNDELKKIENLLSTRMAIYLFLKRHDRNERFYILTNHILPILVKIYRLKGQNRYIVTFLKLRKFWGNLISKLRNK